MFFFDDKVEVKFNVRPAVKENFLKAIDILKASPEEAFEEFVSLLIAQALREENGEHLDVLSSIDKRLSEKVVISRIHKWSYNSKGLPHKMLKAFLQVSENMNLGHLEEGVDRFKMSGYFMNYAKCDYPKFESIFRQMCSNAPRAYGDVFEYTRGSHEVYLNKKYIEVIRSLIDAFKE